MSSQVVFCCCCFLFYLHVDLLRGLAGQLVLFSSLVEHQNEKLKVIAVASSTLVLNIDHGLSSWNQSRCIFNSSFTCFFVGSAARSGVTQVDFLRGLFTNFVPLLLSKPVQILFYAAKQPPCYVFVSMLAVGEMIKVFLMTLFSAGTHQSHCRTCYTIGRWS